MSDEILTLQLAAASGCLRSDWSRQGTQWCTTHGGDWPLCKAAALLPVVDVIATHRAADALEAAADGIPCSDSEVEAKQYLRDFATALRATVVQR